jgi:hypothetical protein
MGPPAVVAGRAVGIREVNRRWVTSFFGTMLAATGGRSISRRRRCELPLAGPSRRPPDSVKTPTTVNYD